MSLFVTWRLSQDNRVLRKIGTEPEVVAYLTLDTRSGFLVNLILENVGQGPACDVEYFVDADAKDFADHEVMDVTAGVTRRIRSLLPQGEQVERLMGMGYRLFGDDEANRLQPFRVKVFYSDLKGTPMGPKEYRLDITEMEGAALSMPSDERIAKSIKKVEHHMKDIAKSVSAYASRHKR